MQIYLYRTTYVTQMSFYDGYKINIRDTPLNIKIHPSL